MTRRLSRWCRSGCCRPRSVASDEEWNHMPQIVLPRRGLFMVHRCGESVLADPTRAIVFGLEEGYRVSHPLDGGDECVVLGFRAEIHEEAIGRLDGCSGRLSPRTQFGASVFVGAVGGDDPDALACEEGAMLLLEALAGELTDASRAEPRSRSRSATAPIKSGRCSPTTSRGPGVFPTSRVRFTAHHSTWPGGSASRAARRFRDTSFGSGSPPRSTASPRVSATWRGSPWNSASHTTATSPPGSVRSSDARPPGRAAL